jgi:hypothetical protein
MPPMTTSRGFKGKVLWRMLCKPFVHQAGLLQLIIEDERKSTTYSFVDEGRWSDCRVLSGNAT